MKIKTMKPASWARRHTMTEKGRRRLSGRKRAFTLMSLFCVASLAGGAARANDHRSPESNDPPRSAWPRPPQAYSADFHLSSLRTDAGNPAGDVSGPMTRTLQQQPFSEAPLRLRDDDPAYNKRSPVWAVGLKVVSTNVFVWAVDQVCFQLFLVAQSGPRAGKTTSKTGWQWDIDRFGMNFFFHPLFRGGLFQFRPCERVWLFQIRAFCLFWQCDVGVFRGNDEAGV